MPYTIERRNGSYCVMKEGDKEPLKCYDTPEDAQAYLGALQANVDDAKRYAFGDTIKSLGKGRVGGYLVRFTGPEQKDLHGEYFTVDTDFLEATFPIKGAPILYNHGLDDTIGLNGIGVIENVRKDGRGIYVEGKLDPSRWAEAQRAESDDYLKQIDRLIEDGLLGWSSGALPQSVKVADDGRILSWGIIEGSKTTSPAGGLHNTRIFTTKSLADVLGRKEPAAVKDGAATVNATNQTHKERKAMDMEKLREAISRAIESVLIDAEKAMYEDEDMKEMMVETEVDDEKGDEMKTAVVETAVETAKSVAELQTEAGGTIDYDKLAAAVVRKNAATYTRQYVEGVVKAYAERQQAARDAVQAAKAQLKASAPAESKSEAVGNVQKSGRVTVGENLRYAHLSDEQLALSVMLAKSSVPAHMQGGLTLGNMSHIFSEDFLRTAAHRVSKAIDRAELTRTDEASKTDYHAMKSARPFKANELNATDITNQGLEWLSVFYDTRLWERARNETRLYDLLVSKGMRTVTIPQGSKSMNVKLNTGSGTVYTASEANSVDATGRPETVTDVTPFTTGEVEEPARKHILAQGVTYDLEEDSIINVTSFLNDDMALTLAEALEDALINGDTATAANTNINLIDGTPAGGTQTPLYIAWDGIRKNFLVTNTSQGIDAGGSLAITTFNDVLSLFPNAIKQRKDAILFLIDSDTEDEVRVLPELLTMDTAGQRATMFTGDLNDNPLFRVTLYTSGFMYRANTAGKISATAGNNTRGTIAAVYAPYWQYGRKRAVTIETDRYPMSQTMVMVASIRHAFKARGADAAVGAYNVR